MVDYIILAEFDDLKGKVIRYSHPTNIVEDICARSAGQPASGSANLFGTVSNAN